MLSRVDGEEVSAQVVQLVFLCFKAEGEGTNFYVVGTLLIGWEPW